MCNNKEMINRKQLSLVWTSGLLLLVLSISGYSTPLSTAYEGQHELDSNGKPVSSFSREQLLQLDINDSTEFYIGRKNMQYSSLIYAQNYNQGIAGTFHLPKFNTQLKTFASDTNTKSNTIDEIGIEDQHNRASGIIWEYTPDQFKRQQLVVTTSYLSGQNSINETSGDAISVSTEAMAMNSTVRLRSEYAESTFKDSNNYVDKDTHQAQHYLISYTPLVKAADNQNFGIWNIGLEKKTIDAHFQTVFNRHLPKDKDITRFFGSYSKPKWSYEASLSYEKNNLHKKLSHSENISHFHLTSRYRKNPKKSTQLYYSLFGNQEFLFQYKQANKDQTFSWLNSDDVFESSFNHNQHQTFIFESKSYYDSWQWFYKLVRTRARDQLDINGDFYRNEIEFGSQFSLAENTSLETKIRSLFSKKIHKDISSNEMHYKLKLNRNLDPLNTSGRIEINYHERMTQLSTELSEEHTIVSLSGDISRRLLEPKGIYPGMNLSLSADYKQEKNTFSGLDLEDYKTQMNLLINW